MKIKDFCRSATLQGKKIVIFEIKEKFHARYDYGSECEYLETERGEVRSFNKLSTLINNLVKYKYYGEISFTLARQQPLI